MKKFERCSVCGKQLKNNRFFICLVCNEIICWKCVKGDFLICGVRICPICNNHLD